MSSSPLDPPLGGTNARSLSASKRREPLTLAHKPAESVGYLVRHAYRLFDRTISVGMAKQGILAGQWSVLRVLWHQEGLSQVEIAERMKVERASLTLLLSGMESSGLITRTPDEVDRRKMRIHLTPKGRDSKRQLLPIGDAVNMKATQELTAAELDTLRQLLARVIASLEKD